MIYTGVDPGVGKGRGTNILMVKIPCELIGIASYCSVTAANNHPLKVPHCSFLPFRLGMGDIDVFALRLLP